MPSFGESLPNKEGESGYLPETSEKVRRIDKSPELREFAAMIRQFTVCILALQIMLWGLSVQAMDSTCHDVQPDPCCNAADDASGSSDHDSDCDDCLSCLANQRAHESDDSPALGLVQSQVVAALPVITASPVTAFAARPQVEYDRFSSTRIRATGPPPRALLSSWLN